jgi:hypothetical protein
MWQRAERWAAAAKSGAMGSSGRERSDGQQRSAPIVRRERSQPLRRARGSGSGARHDERGEPGERGGHRQQQQRRCAHRRRHCSLRIEERFPLARCGSRAVSTAATVSMATISWRDVAKQRAPAGTPPGTPRKRETTRRDLSSGHSNQNEASWALLLYNSSKLVHRRGFRGFW